MAVKRLNNAERDAIRNKLLEPAQEKITEVRKSIKDIITSFIESNIPDEVIKFRKKYPGLITERRDWLSIRDFFCIKSDWKELPEYKKIQGLYAESIDFTDLPCVYDFKGKSKTDIISLIMEDESVLNKVLDFVLIWARLTYKVFSLKNRIDCSLSTITTENSLKNNFPEAYEAYLEIRGLKSNDPCTNTESLRVELNSFKDK